MHNKHNGDPLITTLIIWQLCQQRNGNIAFWYVDGVIGRGIVLLPTIIDRFAMGHNKVCSTFSLREMSSLMTRTLVMPVMDQSYAVATVAIGTSCILSCLATQNCATDTTLSVRLRTKVVIWPDHIGGSAWAQAQYAREHPASAMCPWHNKTGKFRHNGVSLCCPRRISSRCCRDGSFHWCELEVQNGCLQKTIHPCFLICRAREP